LSFGQVLSKSFFFLTGRGGGKEKGQVFVPPYYGKKRKKESSIKEFLLGRKENGHRNGRKKGGVQFTKGERREVLIGESVPPLYDIQKGGGSKGAYLLKRRGGVRIRSADTRNSLVRDKC